MSSHPFRQNFNDGQISTSKVLELTELGVESEELDYKEVVDFGLQKDTLETARDVLGFANTFGGYILLGVDKEYKPVGLPPAYHNDSAVIQQKLEKYFSPTFGLKYGEFSVDVSGSKKKFALLYVRQADDLVVAKIDGQFNQDGKTDMIFRQSDVFVRRGSQTIRASDADIRALVARTRARIIPEIETLQAPEPQPTLLQNIPKPEYQEFVGRERYLRDIISKLGARYFVVSIDGIGGVGKTALAHQVATRCWESQMFNAVVWVSAKSRRLVLTGIEDMVPSLTSYDDLLNQIATVLGFPQLKELEKKEKEEEVKGLLSKSKCLLVVDNLEAIDDADVNDFLKELPDPSKALITSRKRLGEVERIVHLDEMSLEESNELVKLEADAKNVKLLQGADKRTLEAFHKATGGIPLATKWTVGLLALGTPLDRVLKRLGEADSPLLEFCFREAFNTALTDDSRMLLSIMPIFEDRQEEPTREQLSAASGLEGERLDDAITRLVTLSMINPRTKTLPGEMSETTYGILPLTLSFAQAELSKDRALEKEARKRLGRYLSLHKTISEASQQYGLTLEDLGASKTESGRAAALLAILANQAYQRGNYRAAVKLFEQAVSTNPRLSYVYQLWAVVERQEGHFGRANELYEEAARLNPRNPMIWRSWASMKAEMGAIEDARKLSLKGVEASPDDRASLHSLAVNESRAGNFKKAEDLFERALYPNPSSDIEIRQNLVTLGARAESYRRWGVSLEIGVHLEEARGKYLLALKSVEEGLQLSSREWKLHQIQIRAYRNLGELELKAGDLDKADEYLQRALFWTPRYEWQLKHNSEVYLAFAKCMQGLGLLDKAKEFCDFGLRDWPGNQALLSFREELRSNRGRSKN